MAPRWERRSAVVLSLLWVFAVGGCDDEGPITSPPEGPFDGHTTPPDGGRDAVTDADPTPPLDAGPTGDAAPPDGGVPADGEPADGEPAVDGDPPPADGAPPDGGPCGPDPCGEGERCNTEGDARCVPDSCEAARCAPTEACEPLAGGGFECIDDSCADDAECPPEQHCDQICVDDVCSPGARICAEGGVEICAPDGSGFAAAEICESEAPGYESRCADDVDAARCTCRDGWDCPPGLRCEGGRCRGTPGGPACRVDPLPLDGATVRPEFVWGGLAGEPLVGRPFPESHQVIMAPAVANLGDDNGDGLIDARDAPELIFTTYCDSNFTINGTLRAIRGAPPARGAELFAALGPHHWRRGDALPDGETYACRDADLDPNAGLAVGDLDDPATSDGRPEIVAIHEGGGLIIFDNTGARIGEITDGDWRSMGNGPAPAIANIDGAGMAEIVVGPYVQTLGRTDDGQIEGRARFKGTPAQGLNLIGAISCVADLLGDARLEVVAGATVYTMPSPPPGAVRQSDCADIEPADDDEAAWCAGALPVAWRAVELDPDLPAAFSDGHCAVADVWGAGDGPPGPDNPLDGAPEVIAVSEGMVAVFDGATGRQRGEATRLGPGGGGPPTVADIDGDGFPELVSGTATVLPLIDWQAPSEACPAWPSVLGDGVEPPGDNPPRAPGGACATDDDCADGARCADACACLHNGWLRTIEDDSSRVTSAAAFDFDGDGRAEVVYNDECWLRLYDGSGAVRFRHPSLSRTRAEGPIIADVDGDGDAELVVAANDEAQFCSQSGAAVEPPLMGIARDHYNHGVEVWGDAGDRWVTARRTWNQHPYHITHVTEGGAIPLREPPSWSTYGGRSLNSYRSQPDSDGAAPDLVVDAVQIAATAGGCDVAGDAAGGAVTLWALISNIGDLRVGGEITVGFEGTWGAARARLTGDDGAPLVVTLRQTLAPGRSVWVEAPYVIGADPDAPAGPPDAIEAIVDADGHPDHGMARECREDNNRRSIELAAPAPQVDVQITAVEVDPARCPTVDALATVSNAGAAAAEGITVRLYAGDPVEGGRPIGEATVERVDGGAEVQVPVVVEAFPTANVVVYAVVDPDARVDECRDGNNTARAPGRVRCR